MSVVSSSLDFKNIFESMPVVGMVVDTEWRMVAVTDLWREKNALTFEEVEGKSILDVYPNNPNDPDSTSNEVFREFLERTVAEKAFLTKPVQRYDYHLPETGWKETYFTPFFSPVIDDEGSVTHVIHVVVDITDSMSSDSQQ